MKKIDVNGPMVKQVNEAEHKELIGMKGQIQNLRHQVGLFDEQVLELEAQKKQTHGVIQSQKQAFRDRIANIAKSYGIELGTVKEGHVWQFDEPNLLFVQLEVQQPDNGAVAADAPESVVPAATN